jgi:hypothetical protein
MADSFSESYGDLLDGTYDCVDRVVLNAYFPLGHNPGGFRVWWRQLHGGSDAELDQTHLMRMAGRFARRVRAAAAANGIPLIDCRRGERKHRIAEEYLATHDVGRGVFMILVAKAPAAVWKVKRSAKGSIVNLEMKIEYVNHYSFHIIDPTWGHLTIKMSGHPPFGAQVMLNGHEFVACAASSAGIGFRKEENCFTAVTSPQDLAQIADTLSQPAAVGRVSQVCDQWIYSACLCFGLDLAEQSSSRFLYNYSVYQVEYSRNLLFRNGAQMQELFDAVVDRTRSRLDVPKLRHLFGAKTRPHCNRASGPPRLAAVIETPRYDLTIFKLHFGRLTLKAYTKGERVLRFEAIVHNTRELNCGRVLERFGEIVGRLASMADRFCTMLDCVDIGFLADGILEELPRPSQIGATRVGGIDLNRRRTRNALSAVLALAAAPAGLSVAGFLDKVHQLTGQSEADYTRRQAAYDLRKLRAKHLIVMPARTRRYHVPPQAARTIAGVLALRDHIIAPILAGVRSPLLGRKPSQWTTLDRDYERIRVDMQELFGHLGLTTSAAAA